MTFEKQQGKKIGILGLGITGNSVYKYLLAVAKDLIVYDDKPASCKNFTEQFGNKHLASLDNPKWHSLDKIIVSPGVIQTHPIFQLARTHNIQISSDIELFIEENPDAEYVFITGTNGKSTVTALTGHILSSAGLDYHIGGNIGIPVMDLPFGRKGYIFELSSFQIELLPNIVLSPVKISVITNITPDHLDRYKTAEEYTNVKTRILSPDSLKIIGINSPISRKIYDDLSKISTSKLLPVSTADKHIKNGISCHDGKLQDGFFAKESYSLPAIPSLQGLHNQENIGLVYGICMALSVPTKFIIKGLASFPGLAHRNEYIGKLQVDSSRSISFYNDSKATNISSALASLSSFQNIIWFAGGKFKENSLDLLLPILKNIKKAYLFGESKELFANFLSSSKLKPDYEVCENLTLAFSKALEFAIQDTKHEKELTFLLAPACTSYDQFKNFEERGKLFTKLTLDAINSNQPKRCSHPFGSTLR